MPDHRAGLGIVRSHQRRGIVAEDLLGQAVEVAASGVDALEPIVPAARQPRVELAVGVRGVVIGDGGAVLPDRQAVARQVGRFPRDAGIVLDGLESLLSKDAGFDVLIACAFNFDAHASELTKLGPLPILRAKMNPDLHMAEDLNNTGKGNLFVVFGEPDIDIDDLDGAFTDWNARLDVTGRVMPDLVRL